MVKEHKGEEVIFMATDRCNAKCKHCHLEFKGSFKGERLQELAGNATKKHSIVELNGAEVLLHPEYLPVLDQINQNWVLTNGIEIARNPRILETARNNGIDTVGLSHHFDSQESLSPVRASMLEDVSKTVLDAGLKLRLLTAVNQDNYKNIIPICDRATKLGASIISFFNMVKSGNAHDLANSFLTDEQMQECLALIEQARSMYDVDVLKVGRSGTFGAQDGKEKKFKCTAGHNLVVVTPDEKVKPCMFLSGPQYEIGHIEDGSIVIDKELHHDGSKCLVHEIANRGVNFDDYMEK